MLERKIKLLIFAFFIQFIIFNIYSFYPSISQSVSCSPCVVGNCECQVPQGLEFQPTIFGIYESQDCSGNPLFYWKVENGKAVWKPEKTGSYYIRFFVDYKSSQCFSINVGEPDNTPPTTSITTEQKSTNWIKVIFSCSDDKSGCDKTCVCTDTSNTCEPKNCFSWPTQDNFILLPADACTYVRYYSIDKAGNKESMKTTSVGNACGCTGLNPTLNANPTSQRGRPGEEKSYSITITNNDNQNCGSSVFEISVDCLENFECKLDKDQIEINPQASGTITLSIKPSSNVKPGKYKFEITATNQNDPQRSSFIEVEYEVIGEEAIPKWAIKLEASKTTPFIGEEVTLTAKLCEDEECKQPLPLFHYNIYLIDSNTKEAISPTEDCSGKTSCVFRIKEDSEKTRTFYAIISDSNKQDIRGKSNEVSINWVPKIEKNIAITDIKIIDGAVFYKVKNDGKEKMPPTCSAIYIKYGEKEEQVDVSDYVDSIDVGEERWEAFEEEVNKREINRVVNDVCKNHNTFEIKVEVNFGPCAQWGIKEKVKESNENDNNLTKQFSCEDFCKEWEKSSNGQCVCDDNLCDEYYKKWEGVGAKCVNNECKPEKKIDIEPVGIFYLRYSSIPGKPPYDHVCYCIGNKGYETSGSFSVEIYEGHVKIFSITRNEWPHEIECSCIDKELIKNAPYWIRLKPQNEDWAWIEEPIDLKEFVKKNLKLNIPFVDNYPFIYARVGEGDAVWGKTIYYVRGHKYPFSPFPAAPSVMGPCPLIASSDIYYISIAQFLSEPIIRLTLKCKRPGSGKATLCTSPGGDACWQGFCLPEINYACLSSPPVTQMGYIVSSEKSVPITCVLSSEKESYCYYNLKCEKGLWIILNKEGKPLSAPIIQPLSPTLTIPSSSIKSKGKVKVISVCFKPQIKVYSSVFEVS